jgi:L-rhamnose isomerase
MGQSASIHVMKNVETDVLDLTVGLRRLEASVNEIKAMIDTTKRQMKTLNIATFDMIAELRNLRDNNK